MAAELFQADGQTLGHDEGNSRSSHFANAPNKDTTRTAQ
jgi:hypothetical protein